MDLYLIFDLGGTSVKFAVSDKEGKFDSTGSFLTPKDGMERMLEEMGRVLSLIHILLPYHPVRDENTGLRKELTYDFCKGEEMCIRDRFYYFYIPVLPDFRTLLFYKHMGG